MSQNQQTEIYHLKLITGEELFGKITQEDSGIIVTEPLATSEAETRDGSIGFALISFLQFGDPDIKNTSVFFDHAHVVSCNLVHDEMAEFYTLSKHFIRATDIRRRNNIRDTNVIMLELIKEDDVLTEDIKPLSNSSFFISGTNTVN